MRVNIHIGMILFLVFMALLGGFCIGMAVADFTDWEEWGRNWR